MLLNFNMTLVLTPPPLPMLKNPAYVPAVENKINSAAFILVAQSERFVSHLVNHVRFDDREEMIAQENV